MNKGRRRGAKDDYEHSATMQEAEAEQIKEMRRDEAYSSLLGRRSLNRFIWQRSGKYIYPAKEIIFICYYNRNETETVLASKLKQAVN